MMRGEGMERAGVQQDEVGVHPVIHVGYPVGQGFRIPSRSADDKRD